MIGKGEALAMVGSVSIVYGVGLWAPPIAWIIGGALAIGWGILLAVDEARTERRRGGDQ